MLGVFNVREGLILGELIQDSLKPFSGFVSSASEVSKHGAFLVHGVPSRTSSSVGQGYRASRLRTLGFLKQDVRKEVS